MKHKKRLREDSKVNFSVAPLGGLQSVDGVDTTVTDVGNPYILQKLNGFVGSICNRDYLDPHNAIQQLQQKLFLVGLQFTIPQYWAPVSSSEVSSFPLSLFGGRYGMVDNDGIVKQDDGITPKLGYGLNLEIRCQQNPNGSVCVHARIVPQTTIA